MYLATGHREENSTAVELDEVEVPLASALNGRPACPSAS
jgi:hypothetical protein